MLIYLSQQGSLLCTDSAKQPDMVSNVWRWGLRRNGAGDLNHNVLGMALLCRLVPGQQVWQEVIESTGGCGVARSGSREGPSG